jgi:hypothetical protein
MRLLWSKKFKTKNHKQRKMQGRRITVLVLFFTVVCGAKEIYVHREAPKITNPNGPCSTILVVDESSKLHLLLEIISERLQFPAKQFRFEGRILNAEDFISLPHKSLVSVFEIDSLETPQNDM